jgi:NADH-ubiquinone oxidoreductase chain 4
MLLSLLIQIPLFGAFLISCLSSLYHYKDSSATGLKIIALIVTTINLVLSFAIWILFDNSDKHYQFVQEHHNIAYYDVYLGLDSLSFFFVLLTTIIFPLSILSNWKSIKIRPVFFLILMLLLESALLLIFLVLDALMFYIFFESILAPLFILIGVFGASEKIRAGFYFFLYTFLGSLFMLLSIVSMLSLVGCTDYDILSKTNFLFITQAFMFIGIFIAFAVKTPVIYLNGWLLKAHVESPLSGSIVLAAIVLKLSLYGVFRLVLPIIPKAVVALVVVLFVICVITIVYASLSTLRTIDVKELIAYSSVSHAAVYLAGIVSNTIHGIQGGIILGLAHGFVSSGLFMIVGGVLYDRSGTRLITYYAGITQIMPILSILYFILSLGNCGAPLTLNFVGEFMSLYGVFERLPIAGILGSSSIVLSAAYTIYMYNRIALGGAHFASFWEHYMPDLKKREFGILLILVLFTVFLGIYPSIILDSLHYAVNALLYTFNGTGNVTYNDGMTDVIWRWLNGHQDIYNVHERILHLPRK